VPRYSAHIFRIWGWVHWEENALHTAAN